MNIDFTTIAQGAYSGYEIADQRLINSQGEWAEVWQQHTSDTIPPPSLPQVDFSRNQVIAIFAGEKPTGGYSAEILAVEGKSLNSLDQLSLVITVEYHEPGPGEFVTEELTQPHHIIKIPRINANQFVLKRV